MRSDRIVGDQLNAPRRGRAEQAEPEQERWHVVPGRRRMARLAGIPTNANWICLETFRESCTRGFRHRAMYGERYNDVNTNSQTTSTKCQYIVTLTTDNHPLPEPRAAARDPRKNNVTSMIIPTKTCAP